ncbi:MAG: nucleic acid-binding protein [Glaciimonas sp.]|nr:nucleic acid-binding protein [Glaciimonas sp.]
MGFYDTPMWQSMEDCKLALQSCDDCSHVRYPPAPVCPVCLSEHANWKPVAGTGTIVSWVVFHRQYFSDFPAPYNSIAVRLDEGPIIITQLFGTPPEGSWIGRRIVLGYDEHAGRTQHHALLA